MTKEEKYIKVWSEFCHKVERFIQANSIELPFHERLEDAFGILGWFQTAEEIVHEYKTPYGNGNNMKIDFVLQKKDCRDNIIIPVEVKRPGKKIGEKESKQISSYIKALSISYGLLIADNIELYYQKSAETEPVMIRRWELSTEEKFATEFVGLFYSEGFDSEKVKEFCKKHYALTEAKSHLIRPDFVRECLKNELTSKFGVEGEDIKILLEEYNIIVESKAKGLAHNEDAGLVNPRPNDANCNSVGKKNTWLIPSNCSYFNIDACIKKYGEVYWRQKNDFVSGDNGYIYSSSPDQFIKYSVEIVKTDLQYDPLIDRQTEFHSNSVDFEEAKIHNRYALLKITGISVDSTLSLNALRKNGLNGLIQGPRKLSKDKYKNLLEFIVRNFKNKDYIRFLGE